MTRRNLLSGSGKANTTTPKRRRALLRQLGDTCPASAILGGAFDSPSAALSNPTRRDLRCPWREGDAEAGTEAAGRARCRASEHSGSSEHHLCCEEQRKTVT